MTAPVGGLAGEGSFDAATKCCTYQPRLPNFLLGRIIEGPRGPGRSSVEARIDARLGVTPLGIARPPAYGAIFGAAMPGGFGRTPSLLCPHYVTEGGGRCGIWQNRNATCSTWYCKHLRGAVGARFWRSGIERLLVAVEDGLARHCLAELGLEPEAVLATLPGLETAVQKDPEPDAPDGSCYETRWGTWVARERELYIASSRIVEKLSWADVVAASGPTVRLLAQTARKLYEDSRAPHMDDCLRVGAFRVVGMSGGRVRVASYSEYDVIELPVEVIPLLERFDGKKPWRSVVDGLRKREGIEIGAELLQLLVDFEVLVAAEPA
jgi:hypothetical protein